MEKSNIDKTNAWPFVEAKKILRERKKFIDQKGKIVLQTGYGPSGLPHIGTFGEVARTAMLVNALNHITDLPKEIITFSDDMDGLRKIPDNVPNKDQLVQSLHKPLTSVPDPFGKFKSFGEHNNEMLKNFLDQFNFKYIFKSSTELYKSGFFNSTLQLILENYQGIMDVIIPTLGKERQKTYSPFLPICPETGVVLEIPVLEINKESSKIIFDNNGKKLEQTILDGNCKLQWKVDWAMRWYALDVDFEMYGKDLIESAILSTKIIKLLGKNNPSGFAYELFLDEKGEKISKKKGNGITIEEWIKYGPSESLLLFMYYTPKKAKRLYYDVIPKHVDEYLRYLKQFGSQSNIEKLNNPIIHIHSDKILKAEIDISFSLILNLVSACQSDDKNIIWNYIKEYIPDVKPSDNTYTDKLIEFSIQYYKDFVEPNKKYKKPTDNEKKILQEIVEFLKKCKPKITSEEIQSEIYEIGKKHKYELKDWFLFLYEILLGQKNGPRLGTFILLLSIKETIKLIEESFSR